MKWAGHVARTGDNEKIRTVSWSINVKAKCHFQVLKEDGSLILKRILQK